MTRNLVIAFILSVSFTSCTSDDVQENMVSAPSNYTFERNGETTINYSGQSVRLMMAEEMVLALKNNSFSETQLDAMFAHQTDEIDFSNSELNASSKQVRNKIAASYDFSAGTPKNTVLMDFDTWISDQANGVFPVWNQVATEGEAGSIQEGEGGATRFVNSKGLELNQAFAKSLIGALQVDQLLNNYISENVLNPFEQDNNMELLVENKNYTQMEHYWDEAYGYLFGTAPDTANPLTNIGTESGQNGDDSFLSKYLDSVNDDDDFNGIAQEIYKAFKLGRAAIVAKNYVVRNEQAAQIREKISLIIGIRAVYYLQQARTKLETHITSPDYAAIFHDLSEAYGFIYSLQFSRKPKGIEPYVTRTEVQGLLNDVYTNKTHGFWEITMDDLDNVSNTIASRFGFTVTEVTN